MGWEYLRRTRKMLDGYVRGEKAATGKQVTAALEAMYAAEGSDWFWWYGADQDSGDDPAFDLMYRQTLMDVYVDVDGAAGSGSRLLLPGRNAALPESQAWDVAVWAEGWTPGVYRVDEAGQPKPVSTEMKVAVDPVTRRVTIRVPRSAFPEGDPATWGYLRQAQDDYWLSHWTR